MIMSVQIENIQTHKGGEDSSSSTKGGGIFHKVLNRGLARGHSCSSIVSCRSKDSFSIDDGFSCYSNDETERMVCPFSSVLDDIVDIQQQRRLRHEPPRSYADAPQPTKSALRGNSSRRPSRVQCHQHEDSYVPRVHFGNVQVYNHGVELGCNPSVSSGPPIELSWDILSFTDYDFDDYERVQRPNTRHHRSRRWMPQSMALSKKDRRRLLKRAGFTKAAIKKVEKEIEQANWERYHLNDDDDASSSTFDNLYY